MIVNGAIYVHVTLHMTGMEDLTIQVVVKSCFLGLPYKKGEELVGYVGTGEIMVTVCFGRYHREENSAVGRDGDA